MELLKRFDSSGPKKILALDGGGIRGALTLGYLQQIEKVLQDQHNKPDLKLCDYFDLIGGTSTGSIIASLLATGKTVKEIKDLYFKLGEKIFAKKYKWWNIFEIGKALKASYDSGPLDEKLQEVFGDTLLGDDNKIKTGLCIVAKRADTNSVWPLINHPRGKYFNSNDGRNKDIPLWKAVRASAAAPSYFLPQIIDVGGDLPKAAFVDGGVSMANNPALQLLMVATLHGFPFHWNWGADKLLMVSVGTGMSKWEKIPADVKNNNLLNWAQQLPDMFMQDASWHNQQLLQWMSNSPTAWEIDGETGTLANDIIGETNSANARLSYLRYNTWLDAETLKALTGRQYSQEQIKSLTKMDEAQNCSELFDIGLQAATKGVLLNNKFCATKVETTHFPDLFKI
jgi:uncharacterized protein